MLNGFIGESWARRFRERVIRGEGEGGFTTFEEALTEAVVLWHVNAEGKTPPSSKTAAIETTNSSKIKERSCDSENVSCTVPFLSGETKCRRLEKEACKNNLKDEKVELGRDSKQVLGEKKSLFIEDVKKNEMSIQKMVTPPPISVPYKRSLLGTLRTDVNHSQDRRTRSKQNDLSQDGK